MANLIHKRIWLVTISITLFFFDSVSQIVNKHDSIVAKAKIKIPAEVQMRIDSLNASLKTKLGSKEKFNTYGHICWKYLDVRELDMANLYIDTLKDLAYQLQDSTLIVRTLFYNGALERFKGNYAKALDYLMPNLRYNERAGDSDGVAVVLYQIGVVQSKTGDYEKSLQTYYRVMNIERNLGNHYSVGYIWQSIGSILFETKKYTDAEMAYKKASHIYDSLGVAEKNGYLRTNMGNLYLEMGQLAKAKHCYHDALRIDGKNGNNTGVALALANLAFLYDRLKRYDSALSYHLQALELRKKLDSKNYLARSLIGVGLGYSRMQQYDSAKYYSLKALSLVKEIGSRPMLKDVYENLSNIYAGEGDFLNAYKHHVLYSEITDSLIGVESARQINELQTKYETAQKDKQIQLLASARQLQEKETLRQAMLKKGFLIGAILLSLMILLLVFIFRQRLKHQKMVTRKNEEIKNVNFKRQLSELEMKALRAQINPHFLFNCMNSINRMILDGDNESASAYLTKFSKLVRLILENAETATVPLENEIALIESYIQLEELRFKGKIHYNISIDESIRTEDTYLPSMVLQPFVENAIWHGLMPKKENEKSNLFIGIKEENDWLHCTIEDNGVGREKSRLLGERSQFKKRSMGMKITEERLRLLNREECKQSLVVTDMKDNDDNALGTRIEITIPI